MSYFGPFRFIYPPIFLYVAGFLDRLVPGQWGWTFYLAINFVSTVALPILLARYYFRKSWLNAPFVLLAFLAAPQFGGVQALASGNLAGPLYCMIYLAALPGLKKGRWAWFYAAVFAAALIKVNFLLMLILPVFARRRQLVPGSLTVVLVLAVNLVERLAAPHLYSGYQHSLREVLIGENQFGFGVFGLAADINLRLHHAIGTAPYLAMGLFLIALLCSLFVLRDRMIDQPPNGTWLALLVLAIVLANPRVMQYDASFAIPAVLVLLVATIESRHLLAVFLVLFLGSLAVSLLAPSQALKSAFETILLVGSFAAGYARLWLESRKSGKEQTAERRHEQPELSPTEIR